ncbi:hypothetical protein P152DRAFT_473035, partial [Eremomyces bilateralis CBS 781.70]
PYDSLAMRHRMFFALQSRDPPHPSLQNAAAAHAHAHVSAAVHAAQQQAAQQGVSLSPQQIQQVQRRALAQAQQGLAQAQQGAPVVTVAAPS